MSRVIASSSSVSRTWRLLLAIWIPMLLIGHGGGLPCCDGGSCNKECFGSSCGEAEVIEYDVVGDCGPSGHVTLNKEGDSCAVQIDGDAVGVAMSGSSSGTIANGGWMTSAGSLRCTAQSSQGDGSRITVTCTDATLRCTAFFIRSDAGCDVSACDVPTCPADQRLTLSANACCPTCVPCSGCGPVPSDAGNHVTPDTDSGRVEASVCRDARATYDDHFQNVVGTWQRCATDDDCKLTEIDNDCARHCDVVLNEDIYEGDSCDAGECTDWEEALDEYASDLCGDCTPPATECADAPELEPRCIDNTCTAVLSP